MKYFSLLICVLSTLHGVHALIINEIMSNPIGDDSGREWFEVYNNSDSDIDISGLQISVKGGSPVPVFPVSGGATIAARGYGVIGSTLNGTTKFLQDYPSYASPLVRASISLVNSGVTSLEIRLQGTALDTLSSYTAAKEGMTYGRFGGAFVVSSPTPGGENKDEETSQAENTTTESTPTTIPKQAPPSADIVLYVPTDKKVVAGAPTLFSVAASTNAGNPIVNASYTWGFGDGGSAVGSTTLYRFSYPGRYITVVDATNGLVAGSAKMNVDVVAPDITLSSFKLGKQGVYIDINNRGGSDLELSYWKLSINGALYTFPKNTFIGEGVTHIAGAALGFASTSLATTTLIRLLFQNMEEVTRTLYEPTATAPHKEEITNATNLVKYQDKKYPVKDIYTQKTVTTKSKKVNQSSATSSSVTIVQNKQKDARLSIFFKSLFSK